MSSWHGQGRIYLYIGRSQHKWTSVQKSSLRVISYRNENKAVSSVGDTEGAPRSTANTRRHRHKAIRTNKMCALNTYFSFFFAAGYIALALPKLHKSHLLLIMLECQFQS